MDEMIASAQPFQGSETPGAVLEPGTITAAGDQIAIRGMIQQARDTTSDPRLSGSARLEVNALFDAATFSGPLWGTLTVENAQGQWLAGCAGFRTAQGYSILEAVGYGMGAYQGLKARWRYTRDDPSPSALLTIQGLVSPISSDQGEPGKDDAC